MYLSILAFYPYIVRKLFPELINKQSVVINLDTEAQAWLAKQPPTKLNPLLDPVVCQTLIDECHRKYDVDFSYGGWMENRSTLWRGTYLDDDQRYIHLGVDVNVPAGTTVVADEVCTVIRIDNDYPDKHGWGTRVITKQPHEDVVRVFAHLDQRLNVRLGDELKAGAVVGTIGLPPFNGDWFPHLHIQMIDTHHYDDLLKNNLRDLDGYGRIQNIEFLRKTFPDPLHSVSLT
ncbi:MAG: peptidoglycan DD-metalloendopeptidase family protein [Candidatus Uhrbacteria bacterium]|nr:peptidoglycan DD-metalloendopeptidase family protein [Candidatus Uhrbacteria bacterium]